MLLLLFSHSIVSNSLRPHGLQHTRLPCPSPSSRTCSNSCPLSRWCHPTISSSVIPSSSCLQSFPATGSFQMSPFFTSGGQSIGVSALASVLPMNIQDWSPSGWTGLLSLQSKGLSRDFSSTTVQKHQFFHSAFFIVQLSHPYMTTGKTIALTEWRPEVLKRQEEVNCEWQKFVPSLLRTPGSPWTYLFSDFELTHVLFLWKCFS